MVARPDCIERREPWPMPQLFIVASLVASTKLACSTLREHFIRTELPPLALTDRGLGVDLGGAGLMA